MTEAERQQRNTDKITELWSAFGRKIAAVLHDMEGNGLRPRIQCAWRSPADQLEAFNTGHSKLRYGFHNVTGAGGHPEALAVDILDDNNPNNESTWFLLVLAACAEAHGLTTGIRWGLPQNLRDRIDRIIAAKAWGDAVKVGWDPCHTEITGMTAVQAKQGMRP